MCTCHPCFPDLRAMTLSVGSSSCGIRLVCTIHAFASDLSRKPGIRLHLPLRLFISTLNKCPFCGITRYAMLIMSVSMARGHQHCTAGASRITLVPYGPTLLACCVELHRRLN